MSQTRTQSLGRPRARPVVARRRSAWPSLVGLAGTLGAAATMMLGVFSVRHVTVVGTNLPASAIAQVSGVQGQNIFTVQRDQVIQRLQQVPAIEVTRVDTTFPDTVTVYATLRQPYLEWKSGKTMYLLDARGHAIGTTTTYRLPLLIGDGPVAPPDFPTMQAVRYAARVLPHVTDGLLSAAHLSSKLGLVLYGQSGWRAVIGSGDSQAMGTRVATLGSLLQYVSKKGIALGFADLHLRYGFFCQRGGTPCHSLPPEFGGTTAAPTPGVTATQP